MKNKLLNLRLKFMTPRGRADYLRNKGILKLGVGCEIYERESLGSEPYLIKLGNRVRVPAGVRFITHDGGMWVLRNLGWNEKADKMGKIEVGDNVFFGINSIIMPGVTIGSNVIIGASSVVTKNIPDNMVYAGIPAKPICMIEDYYNKNKAYIYDTKQLSHTEKKLYYTKKFNIDL
ncbi:acyltransferase [Paenibacillus glycanilyticus]|uniref:acyltransferase n=1 Tax=Paenibacillus glycanilyticus TaxID=126569 RepID=UPI000FDA0FD4|nr:acyltransferase [Paenibacillus glycanilyticus]